MKGKTVLLFDEEGESAEASSEGFFIPFSSVESGPQTVNLSGQKQSKIKNNDYDNIKKKEIQKKVDLLCGLEIFENISIKNFRDLLQSAKEEFYMPGEFIIQQGTIGTKFFFVQSGIVVIFPNNRAYARTACA